MSETKTRIWSTDEAIQKINQLKGLLMEFYDVHNDLLPSDDMDVVVREMRKCGVDSAASLLVELPIFEKYWESQK